MRELPGVGRVTLAPQHISQGDILAAIPRRTCFAAERNEWVGQHRLLWMPLLLLLLRAHICSGLTAPHTTQPATGAVSTCGCLTAVRAAALFVSAAPGLCRQAVA